MKQIDVIIHRDEGIWWAEAPMLPGFSSAAETLAELRELVRDGVKFALETDNFILIEVDAHLPKSKSSQSATSGKRKAPLTVDAAPRAFSVFSSRAATNPRLVSA